MLSKKKQMLTVLSARMKYSCTTLFADGCHGHAKFKLIFPKNQYIKLSVQEFTYVQ